MKFNIKIVLVSALALLCMSTQGMLAMIAPWPNLVIMVRQHQPSGIFAHHFNLPSTSTVGDLQQAISQRIGADVTSLVLVVSKSHLEESFVDKSQNYRVEVTQVLDNPQHLLAHDKEFGIPIVQHHQLYSSITEYVIPCYDLVSLSDFKYSSTLFHQFKTLLEQKRVVNRMRIADIFMQARILQNTRVPKKDNNDFKEFDE